MLRVSLRDRQVSGHVLHKRDLQPSRTLCLCQPFRALRLFDCSFCRAASFRLTVLQCENSRLTFENNKITGVKDILEKYSVSLSLSLLKKEKKNEKRRRKKEKEKKKKKKRKRKKEKEKVGRKLTASPQSLPQMRFKEATRDVQPSAPDGSVLISINGYIIVSGLWLGEGGGIRKLKAKSRTSVRGNRASPNVQPRLPSRSRGRPVVHPERHLPHRLSAAASVMGAW